MSVAVFSADESTVQITYQSQTWNFYRPVISPWAYVPSGKTYWVATTGNDGALGTQGAPFLTIGHAISVAVAGDLINVQAGTYVEHLAFTRSGSSGSPIILSCAPGALGNVVITLSQSYVQGLDHPEVVNVPSNLTDIWINGLVIQGWRDQTWAPAPPVNGGLSANGISFQQGTTRCRATNCVTYANQHCGMKIMDNVAGTSLLFEGNINFSNGVGGLDHGIYCTTDGCTMNGNILLNNMGWGLHLYHSPYSPVGLHATRNICVGGGQGGILLACTNSTIYNNTCVANDIGITYYALPCAGNLVKNNIFAFNTTRDGFIDNGSGAKGDPSNNTDDYNDYYPGNTYVLGSDVTYGTHELHADPGFTNRNSGDYRLGVGSPCIGAGVNVGLPGQGANNDIGALGSVAATIRLLAQATTTYPTQPQLFIQVDDSNNNAVQGTLTITIGSGTPISVSTTQATDAYTVQLSGCLPGDNAIAVNFAGSGPNAGLSGAASMTITEPGVQTTIGPVSALTATQGNNVPVPVSVTGSFQGSSAYNFNNVGGPASRPLTFVGQSGSVAVLVETALTQGGLSGQSCAASCLSRLGTDMQTLQAYFGTTTALPSATLLICAVNTDTSNHDGTGGAYHPAPSPVCYCDAALQDSRITSALFISEMSEVGQSLQNFGWKGNYSTGEALSRVHAEATYPGILDQITVFLASNGWLNNTSRPDSVTQIPYPNDSNVWGIGCDEMFLYWLRDFRAAGTFTVAQITQAGNTTFATKGPYNSVNVGPTLADLYFNLTALGTGQGDKTAFNSFNADVNSKFPTGSTYNYPRDDIWLSTSTILLGPLPTPPTWSPAPQGNVTVSVAGTAVSATGTLAANGSGVTVSLPTTSLNPGTYTLSITYPGLGVFAAATATTAQLTVQSGSSATAINSVTFETGDLTKCFSNVSATVVGTVALWGRFSLRLQRNSSSANAVIGATSTTRYSVPTAFARWYFMYSQRAAAGSHTPIAAFEDSVGSGKGFIHLDGNGHLIFQDSSGTALGTGTTTLQPGVVYMLQAKCGTGTNAPWEVRINGNVELTGTSSNLTPINNGDFKLGGNSPYTDTFYYDEIAVDSAQYPGPVSAASAGTPSGSVALTMDGVSLGSQMLSSGSTTFTVGNASTGLHSLVFTFTSTNFATRTQTVSLSVSGGKTTNAGDNLALTDLLKVLLKWAKASQDNLALTDLITTLQLTPKSPKVLDNLALGDGFLRLVRYLRGVPDAAGLTDVIGKVGSNRGRNPPGDNLGLTDLIGRLVSTREQLSDNLALTDLITTALIHARVISARDSLGLSDVVARIAASLRQMKDSLGLSDTTSTLRFGARIPLDNLGLTDLLRTFVPAHPKPTDNLGLSDAFARIASVSRVISDVIGAAEVVGGGLNPLAIVPLRWRADTLLGRWRRSPPVVGQDWTIVRGEDKTIFMVSDAGPVNITGWRLVWSLRAFDSPVPIAVWLSTDSGLLQITDAKNGLMRLNLQSWQTKSLTVQPTPWYWELARLDVGARSTLARGTLTILQEDAAP